MGRIDVSMEKLQSVGMFARLCSIDHHLHCTTIPPWRSRHYSPKNLRAENGAICLSVFVLSFNGPLRKISVFCLNFWILMDNLSLGSYLLLAILFPGSQRDDC